MSFDTAATNAERSAKLQRFLGLNDSTDSPLSSDGEGLHRPPQSSASANRSDPRRFTFKTEKHVRYFLRHLEILPEPYSKQDSIYMTLLYFMLSGLDVVANDSAIDDWKERLIQWVYRRQLHPLDSNAPGGFSGDYFNPRSPKCSGSASNESLQELYEPAVVHTWAALSILAICGDDFSGIDRPPILRLLHECQLPNGCMSASPYGLFNSESDGKYVLISATRIDSSVAYYIPYHTCVACYILSILLFK